MTSKPLTLRAVSWGRRALIPGAILLFALLLRLYQLNVPSMDFLSWRDTQTLMVARNFAGGSMNPLLPKVDWRTTTGPQSDGTVGGTELQVVPWLTAWLFRAFGVQPWAGRVVPIVFSLLGLIWFYRLGDRFYGPRCAAWAMFLLAVSPYHLVTSRLQMPESFVFAMSFGMFLYFDRWLEGRRPRDYGIALAMCLLMLLGKPNFAVMAIPMAWLTLSRLGMATFRSRAVYIFAIGAGLPFLVYVFYSNRILIPRTGLSFAQPDLFRHHLLLTADFYTAIAGTVWSTSLTPLVATLALLGIAVPLIDRKGWFVHAWLLGAVALFVLTPGGGRVNGYYQMVLAPPALMLVGRLADAVIGARRGGKLSWRAVATGIVLLLAGAQCLQRILPAYQPINAPAYACGTWLNRNTDPGARILTATPNTTALYHANRIGWTTWFENYGTPIVFGFDVINRVGPLGASSWLGVPDPLFHEPGRRPYAELHDTLYETYWSHTAPQFTVFDLHRTADLALPEGGRIAFGLPESRKYLRGPWGLDGRGTSGAPLVELRAGPTGKMVFETAKPLGEIWLTIAPTRANQPISIAVNGGPPESFTLAGLGPRRIRVSPLPPLANGPHSVILETEPGAGLVVFGLEAGLP